MKLSHLSSGLLWATTLIADPICIEPNRETRSLLPEFTYECLSAAQKKIKAQAEANDVKINPSSLKIVGADKNALAAYLWWEVTGENAKGEQVTIRKMTQKPVGDDCF